MENATTAAPVECLVRLSWSEHQRNWFIVHRDEKPVAALAFETSDKNQRRSWSDQGNYVIGCWNAWIKSTDGQQRLTWSEGTSIAEMQSAIEAADVRLR